MSKTENVFARVEPQIKEQAEAVLNQLGISMSNAVGLFLQQVVIHQGIPFELKLPTAKPISLGLISDAEFNAIMNAGLKDYSEGHVQSAEEVRMQMKRNFNI